MIPTQLIPLRITLISGKEFNQQSFGSYFEGNYKSTLPNTKSIDPNTAIRSPKLIDRQNLLSWFKVRKSFEIIVVVQ